MSDANLLLDAPHVLVVDDDATVLRAVAATIRRIAPTKAATCVAEARALLDGSRHWLALVVDYALGDGTGLDVVAEARRRAVRAPALLLTAMTPRSWGCPSWRSRSSPTSSERSSSPPVPE